MTYRRTTRYGLALVTWCARTWEARATVQGVASGRAHGPHAEPAIVRAIRAMA